MNKTDFTPQIIIKWHSRGKTAAQVNLLNWGKLLILGFFEVILGIPILYVLVLDVFVITDFH